MAACRLCSAPLARLVVDLGMSPLCESYRAADELNRMEPFYPLRAWVCDACWLMQVDEYVSPAEIFGEYAYFSSYSDSWLAHARAYVAMIVDRLALGPASFVVELGSNDGYLLQYLVARGVPVLGIEPAANVAAAARARGVPTRGALFGSTEATRVLADEGRTADLVIGNNVLAQVSDLNDFVAGIAAILAPEGVVTLEFPHLARLLAERQFDTIYHEHFSYFSLATSTRALAAHGLRVFDVEALATHGGSLRLYACHAGATRWPTGARVAHLATEEAGAGLERPETYAAFAAAVQEVKRDLLEFLIRCRREGAHVAGYGAPGKGNTLLNYCGIRTDLLEYTVDRNPYKHGKFLPGTHVPIHGVEHIAATRPDYVLILPWNLREEIMGQMAFIRDWGGRFVVAIPRVQVHP